MFIVVDLVIVAVLLLCTFLGYKRGLTGCLIRILSFFIALAVAFVLFKPAAAIITDNTEVDENIKASIVQVFESEEKEEGNNAEEEKSPVIKYISDEIENATEEKKQEIVDNAAQELSIKIVNILAFIVIFIAVRIALIFVKILADLITKLPIIKECDKIGGVIYGVLQGLVIVFIALALITFISTATNQYTLLEMVNQSYIGSILNNNNILLNVIF